MSERTINFDTHRFVKRLVESGLAEKTAEVLADEQARLLTDNLASKNDLESGLAMVRADLEKRAGINRSTVDALDDRSVDCTGRCYRDAYQRFWVSLI